ncbi:MAG: ATP-dependent Clp protease proteolytic subunit [Dehalococcoidia bacterium]
MAQIVNRDPTTERKARAQLVWRVRNAGGGQAEIDLFDQIGEDWWGDGTSAKSFTQELRDLGAVSEIRLNINSPGGVIDDALAMYDALRTHPAHVTAHIITAYSAATIVAMAADTREITTNGKFMIHDAMAFVDVFGYLNAAEISEIEGLLTALKGAIDKESDNIASIYAERAGGSVADWRDRMLQNGKLGTTYHGQEAVDIGLAHSVASAGAANERRAPIVAIAAPEPTEPQEAPPAGIDIPIELIPPLANGYRPPLPDDFTRLVAANLPAHKEA